MFSWFKSGEKSPPYRHRDLVWPTAEAKWIALPGLVQQYAPAMVFGWFQTSLNQATAALAAHSPGMPIAHARHFSPTAASGATVILVEHYPLPAPEAHILQSTLPANVLVLSSLDDPLIRHFTGDRLAGMLSALGMAPDEMIEHAMISANIRRAQEKLAEQVVVDFAAESAEAWFRRVER